MKPIVCENCGGDEFVERDGYRLCLYCKSRFRLSKEDMISKGADIDLNEDVHKLLQKCRTDPIRAHKYATLILEIDPRNKEARSILAGR